MDTLLLDSEELSSLSMMAEQTADTQTIGAGASGSYNGCWGCDGGCSSCVGGCKGSCKDSCDGNCPGWGIYG